MRAVSWPCCPRQRLSTRALNGTERFRRRLQIESDKVVFNEKPDMKAREITEAAKEALISGKFDMVRVNFANPDMVGHTGDLEATKTVRAPSPNP